MNRYATIAIIAAVVAMALAAFAVGYSLDRGALHTDTSPITVNDDEVPGAPPPGTANIYGGVVVNVEVLPALPTISFWSDDLATVPLAELGTVTLRQMEVVDSEDFWIRNDGTTAVDLVWWDDSPLPDDLNFLPWPNAPIHLEPGEVVMVHLTLGATLNVSPGTYRFNAWCGEDPGA